MTAALRPFTRTFVGVFSLLLFISSVVHAQAVPQPGAAPCPIPQQAGQGRHRNRDRVGGARRSAAVANAGQRHGDLRPRARVAAAVHARRGAALGARLHRAAKRRAGTLTSVFTRGGESDFTLVLVDGVRANAFGGGIDLSQVPLEDVERIEVVRGPQSALYGSDAIGGVVQVITRSGGRPSAQRAARRRQPRRCATPRRDHRRGQRRPLAARRELLRRRRASPARAPTARPSATTMRRSGRGRDRLGWRHASSGADIQGIGALRRHRARGARSVRIGSGEPIHRPGPRLARHHQAHRRRPAMGAPVVRRRQPRPPARRVRRRRLRPDVQERVRHF